MGMYTGIRFKGIVSERFRKGFDVIALNGEWENFDDEYFKDFGRMGRSGFIPCGVLCYMPNSWEKDYINLHGEKVPEFSSDFGKPLSEVYYLKQIPTDGFATKYNEDTGYWSFQCSLKNYNGEIERFFDLLPYFIESVEHLEYFYEEDKFSQKYELIDNKIIMTNSKFIKYD